MPEKVIGLVSILKIYGLKNVDLAEKLNCSRKLITEWTSGRIPIPKKRLTQLYEIFDLPEEYFQKELNKTELMHVRMKVIKDESELKQIQDELSLNFTEQLLKSSIHLLLLKEQEKDNGNQFELLGRLNKIITLLENESFVSELDNLIDKYEDKSKENKERKLTIKAEDMVHLENLLRKFQDF